jgi:biotin-(acetyl-CoA carboxylase) ligase
MKIINLDTVPSTNSYLLEREDLLAENLLAVRARKQTAGRGRHAAPGFPAEKKTWRSPLSIIRPGE